MKNKEIHDCLLNKEARDFLGKNLHKSTISGGPADINFIKKQIKELEELLIHCENYKALKTLIKTNKWEVFDVSDEVLSYDKNEYFPFIGTQSEYEALEKKIKNDKHVK